MSKNRTLHPMHPENFQDEDMAEFDESFEASEPGKPGVEEQRNIALEHLLDAWDEALGLGVAPDLLAGAAIYAAFSDMVDAMGEEEAAKIVDQLPQRIRQGEFTIHRINH